MSNHKLLFLDKNGFHFIEVKKETSVLYTKKEDSIKISIGDFNSESIFIHLDKSTAIKFAKTLRTEINKIEGVQNV